MTDTQQWGAIVGALLPPVMAVIIQTHWSQVAKSWAAFLVCVVAAGAVAYFTGQIHRGPDPTTIGTTVALVAGMAWAMYHGFWKTSGIAPAIEAKTNLPHIGIIPVAPPPAPPAEPPAAA